MIILLFCGITAFGQDTTDTFAYWIPDYTAIEKELKNSPQYEELFERWWNADTTMSMEDLFNFYYGAAVQPGYSGYNRCQLCDSLADQWDLIPNDSSDVSQRYIDLLPLARKAMENEPFNAAVFNFMVASAQALKNEDEALKRYYLLDKWIGMLMLTGDGLSHESAIYVTNTIHEYYFMSYAGVKMTKQSLSNGCDVMTLQPNEYDIDELYFNVEHILYSFRPKLKE